MDLTGKSAIVTGASGGIGRAIALRLLELSANVLLVARNEDRLGEIARESVLLAGKAAVLPCDITEPGNPEAIVKKCALEFGGVDILVNNAAYGYKAPACELSLDELDRCYDTNVRAPFALCRAAYPYFLKSGFATVLNIGSVVSHKGYESQCAYAVSKHALLGMTKVMAREWAKEGIRVLLLSPGGVATEMGKVMRPDLDPGEMSRPEEIADIAAFMITQRGNSIIDEIRVHRASSQPWQ